MSSAENNVESLLKKLVKHQKQMNSLLSDVLTTLGGSGSATDSEKKEKKPRKANAWSGWVKHAPAAHVDDFAKYREAHPDMKGHAIQFAKEWKEAHTSEYEAFVAEHAEKQSVADGSASESEAAAPVAAKPVKKVAKKAAEKVVAAPAHAAEKPKVKRVIKKTASAPTSDASEAE